MREAMETAPTATRSSMRAMRHGAIRARKVGTEATVRAARAAEQVMTERGVAPQRLSAALAESADVARREFARSTRRTRRKLMRTSRRTRRDLARTAVAARRQAAKARPVRTVQRSARQLKRDATRSMRDANRLARAEGAKSGRRRWWLWALLAGVAAAVAYTVRSQGQPAGPLPGPHGPVNGGRAHGEPWRESNGMRSAPGQPPRRDTR